MNRGGGGGGERKGSQAVRSSTIKVRHHVVWFSESKKGEGKNRSSSIQGKNNKRGETERVVDHSISSVDIMSP